MPFSCAFCPRPCTSRHPYRFGTVGGFLCGACARTMQSLITQWVGQRSAQLAQENETRPEPAKADPSGIERELHPRTFRRQAG